MKKLNCPICGSEMEIDKESGIGTCLSCGTKVQIYDKIEVKNEKIVKEETINKTEVIRDEAKIKELENQEKARLDELEEKRKIRKLKIISGTIFLAIGLACCVICVALGGMDTSQGVKPIAYLLLPGIGFIIAGIVILCKLKEKKTNN